MVLVLLSWLLWTILFWPLGKAVCYATVGKQENGLSIAEVLMLGMALVAFEGIVYSCFAPLDFTFKALVTTQSVACFLLYDLRREIQISRPKRADWPWYLVLSVFAFGLMMKAAAPIGSFDAGLYYRPTINWLSEYGLVPGLGNLHGRLAFNSAWHTLVAGVQLPLGNGVYLEDLNEYLVLIFLVFATEHVRMAKKVGFEWMLLLIGIPLFLVQFLSAPAPDLPVYVCSLFIFMRLLKVLKAEDINHASILFLLWIGAFLLFIKLSSLSICLLLLGLILQVGTKLRVQTWALTLLPLLLVGAAWVFRFYTMTGYLAYPLPSAAVNIGRPDWTIPTELVKAEVQDVEGFAKVPMSVVAPTKMPMAERAAQPMRSWIRYWAEARTWKEYVFFLIYGISLVLVLAKLARMVSKGSNRWLALGTLLYIFGSLGLWFLKAPDPRFFIGQLVGVPILAIGVLRLQIRTKAGVAVAVMAALWFCLLALDVRSVREYALVPAGYGPTLVKTLRINNLEVLVPLPTVEGGWETRCYDAPIPCTFEEKTDLERLEMRGTSLKDGFRTKQDN